MFKKGKSGKRARGRGIGSHRRDYYDSHGKCRPHKRPRAPVFNRTSKGTTISPSVKHSEADLRDAIKTMYCRHGSPPKEDWRALGTVGHVADALRCSDATVLKVLNAIDDANRKGKGADVRKRKAGTGGHNAKILPGTDAGDVLVGGISTGFGERATARLVSTTVDGMAGYHSGGPKRARTT